jgi:serine/threonine protein kinase/Tol biopolymer transport system component
VKLAPGARLGPYEILAPLGAGAMGEVYSANDTRLGRTVAVKILPAEFAEDVRLTTRFEAEAKAISALSHPNICALYDVGPGFLVMEYCEGKTLARRIEQGALPIEQVIEYGIQIAGALDAAHRAGIVHRDLKPSNIMVTRSGLKLLDFGLARQRSESSPDESTVYELNQEETVAGTVRYMAPELLHGKEADARSDIFALGLVLYEMAMGRPAFNGESKASLIAAILEHEPEPLKPSVAFTLDRLIRSSLVKNPVERIQAAHDVKLQLQWILESDIVGPIRTSAFSRWSILVAVAAAVIAAAVTWFLQRPRFFPSPLRRFSILLPPNAPIDGKPAISRDGRWMVYRSSNTAPLYIRSMDRGEVRPLPGTEGGDYPFFSPNGEWIAFNDNHQGVLKKIAVAGGAPILVCKTALVRGGTWLPDDTIIFGSMGTPLQRVSSGGGTQQELTRHSADHAYWPSALNDGRHVLYTIGSVSGNYDQAKIAAVSIREGLSRVILEGGTSPRYARGHLIYAHSGTLFAVPFDPDQLKVSGSPVPIANDVAGYPLNGGSYFDVADDGTVVDVPSPSPRKELVWVNRKGVAAPASNIRREYGAPRISPDGEQIAIEISDDIWLFDLKREAWTRLTAKGQNLSAVWSPDGSQIFFASNRNGSFSVYSVASDGGQLPRQLTHDQKSWTFPRAISLDARNLVLWRSEPRVQNHIFVIDPSQPDTEHPFVTTGEGSNLDLSQDDQWMAFSSDETGRMEIYLSAFPSAGRKWPVSIEGGTTPHFRADGRELFYRNGNKMMAVDVSLGPKPHLGKPRMLFEGDYEDGFDVTRDGRRFVMVRKGKQAPAVQLNVIIGMFDNLRP